MNYVEINKFVDLIDEACLLIYNVKPEKYGVILKRVSQEILGNFKDNDLDEATREKLGSIYQKIYETELKDENEVLLAIQLLQAKALKHINYSLDYLVPDFISLLINQFIESKSLSFQDILDVNIGTGMLLLNLIIHLDNKKNNYYGINNDDNLIDILVASSNLINRDINILYEDIDAKLVNIYDMMIGNLSGELLFSKDLPYKVILERLNNLKKNGYFVFLIDNDFFANPNLEEFKEKFNLLGSFLGLISLPKQLVQEEKSRKSILIGKKTINIKQNILIVNIPDFKKETLEKTIIDIKTLISKI
ncbi:MAG: hypothetical protein WC278_03575 [Bacilli bacterium]|jgi:SAM-dependent methyltransferase|nr:hypothetical protein [Bacilli bacterium]MDD2681582.1 hypothetical protein [Bacilli bacterium]MDD4062803.1 hypothetical protein [Bacilli bacterium]MDD5182847.1 hypothetical protein [Bacilli bacterium]MDY0363345.1 hypothetical protein [Bacilli bacterium]